MSDTTNDFLEYSALANDQNEIDEQEVLDGYYDDLPW